MTAKNQQKLGFTAIFTSQVWIRGGLPEAHLFDIPNARPFFWTVTTIYDLARRLHPGMKPLLPALLHRHCMIDHLLEREAAPQVLELAAGLSPRGAHYSRDEALRYTEVDLPHVVTVKRRLLSRSARGRSVAARANLHLVPTDINELDLQSALENDGAAFVVAEGLHMYLPVEVQRRLWSRLATALGRGPGGVFVFDHFQRSAPLRRGLVSQVVGSFMERRQRRIGFVEDRRTADDVAGDLLRAGFDQVELHRSRDTAHSWRLPHADVETDVVILAARRDAAPRA